MASITDYAHRIRFEKVKDTHFTSSSRFQGHPFNFEPRPKLDLAMQTSTSWSKKMSGGYLVLRLSWPPRPSKGGGNLLRHSLDSSLLSSTHIDDKKTIAQRRMHLDKYKAWAWIDPNSLSMMIHSCFCLWNVKMWRFQNICLDWLLFWYFLILSN